MTEDGKENLLANARLAQQVLTSDAVGQLQKQIAVLNQTNRLNEIAKIGDAVANAVKAISFVDQGILKRIREATDTRLFLPPNINLQFNAWTESLKSAVLPLAPMFKRFSEQSAKARLVEESGFLPHTTTPFDLIDEEKSADEIADILGAYYTDHWDDVEATFKKHVESHSIDDEAKACFREALQAHKAGLYRAVPRTLFPEIERVASVEFYGGKHKATTHDGKTVGITSLPTIRYDIRNLPAGEVINYDYGWQLFMKMEDHLYEKVGDNPEEIAKFEADPVPNRHASLHGIVSYTTAQSSLNALIMTDFLFHMMTRAKTYMEEVAGE